MMDCKAGLQMQTYPMYGTVGAPIYKAPNSPKGIWWCIVAFSLYLGALGAQLGYGIWSVVNLDALASSHYNYALTAAMFAFTAVILIFELIVLVFYFIGFGYLYGGRTEFDPGHAKHVNISMGLIIAAMVTVVVGSVIVMALQMQTWMYPPSSADEGIFYGIVGAQAIVNTLVAAFAATAIVLSVQGLVDKTREMHLYIAAGLGTATPGIASAFAFWQLPSIIDALSDGYFSSYLNVSTGWPTLVASLLGLVTFFIILLVYLNVWKRIKEGQVKPSRPPVAPQMVWVPIPMVPVMPMYPPYAPAQPVQPQQPGQPPEPGKQESAQKMEYKVQ